MDTRRLGLLGLVLAASLAHAGCGLAITGGTLGWVFTQDDDDDPANQPPTGFLTTPTALVNDVVAVRYTVIDAESNPVNVRVIWSSDGGTTWSPASATAASAILGHDGTSGLASSPTGVPHTFQWNTFLDLRNAGLADDFPQVRVRVQLTQSDGLAGPTLTSGTFGVWNRYTATVAGGQDAAFLDSIITPSAVALDANGDLLVADPFGHKVVRVAAQGGALTVVAGTGQGGFNGDNILATAAQLSFPTDVAVDAAGNVFIADPGNSAIRRVDASTGFITTVAGNGNFGFFGDGGTPTGATLAGPEGIDVDAQGNLWIADTGNDRIRFVNRTASAITFTFRQGAVNSLVIVQPNAIDTLAGGGALGLGDNGHPKLAKLDRPGRVRVLDFFGFTLGFAIGDTDHNRVRTVNLLGPVDGSADPFFGTSVVRGQINTVAGGGLPVVGQPGNVGDGGPATSGILREPNALDCFANALLWVADTGNGRVRIVAGGIIDTLAGNGGFGYAGDGGLSQLATLAAPLGVRHDWSFNTFVADTFNGRVRMINPQIWQAVTATAATDVWVAGGSGTVTRTTDGATFTRTSVGPPELLVGLSASGSTDVVAVGFQGGIHRWNGATWTPEASGTTLPLLDVHAVSAGVQYVVGVNGLVLNYAGSGSWTAETSGTTASLSGVHGVSGSVAWAVGDSGTIRYRNGSSSWGSAPGTPPAITTDYQGVFALGSSPVYLCGEVGTFVTWDGTTWTDRTSATGVTTHLKEVWAASASNVWLVGDNGVILHFDGSNVTAQASGTTEDLSGVFGTSASDVYAVGSIDTILHYDGNAWAPLLPNSSVTYAGEVVGANTIDSLTEPPATQLVAVSAPRAAVVEPSGDVLFSNAGTHQVMRLDQTTRAVTVLAGTGRAGFAGDTGAAGAATAPTGADLLGIWGASDTDVWAVGTRGTILRGNGSTWTAVPSGVTVELWDVHGSGTSDVWAVGEAGTILHWNGTTWSRRASGTTQDLNGVFAVSASFAIAVGDAGTILSWSNGQWSDMLAGATVRPVTDLAEVWASSTTDAWAVGAGTFQAGQGPLWRYQSGAWGLDTLPLGASPAVGLIDIFATSATNVWAVGESSAIYRYSGSWAAETSAFTFPVNVQAVFGRSGSDVFAGGAFGTFQASTGGGAWTSASGTNDTIATSVGLRAGVGFSGGRAYVAGEDGTVYVQTTVGGAWTLQIGVARLSDPHGLAVRNNVCFIADSGNHRIRAVNLGTTTTTVWGGTNTITLAPGAIATVAGGATVVALGKGDTGAAVQAELSNPAGLSLNPANGDLYIADSGHNRIRRVTASSGVIDHFAGHPQGTQGFAGDGSAANATSCQCNTPFGVRIDPSTGDVYLADTGNHRIRRVLQSTGNIATVVGTGTPGFNSDGLGPLLTDLNTPTDVGLLGSDWYVVDYGNHRIRKVTTGGSPVVSTVAGTGSAAYGGDPKPGPNAELNSPFGIVPDAATGVLYVADSGNNRVRRFRP